VDKKSSKYLRDVLYNWIDKSLKYNNLPKQIDSGDGFGEEIFDNDNESVRMNSILVKEYCELLVLNKANILLI